MENKNIFAEAKILDDGERHLILEMLISRMAHGDREIEKHTCKTISKQSLSN
jgi:hypothetical protein